MLKYSHPTLAWILDYWPVTIFAPAVLLVIAVLALVTRWWDRRDEEARQAVQAPAPAADVSWQSAHPRPTPTPRAGHDVRTAS